MENSRKDYLVPPESSNAPTKGGFIPPDDRGENMDVFPKDIFGYRAFGVRLANIVCQMQTPLVVALTGAWGSGKSVFGKQWAGELREKWAQCENGRKAENAPVIYFDAFANDYQDNPFLVLAGEAMVALEKCGAKTENLKETAIAAWNAVSSASTNALVHVATGGAVDVEKIAANMKTALAKQLESVGENRAALESFRKALEDAAKEIGDGQPLVFIVDELDRCRPDFALELLEKIKHLFSVPNVCFLVVTNLEQFQAVIRRTYGYDAANARIYLDKFFHHVFQLPKVKRGKERLYVEYLFQSSRVSFPFYDSDHTVRGMLTEMAIVHRLELRDIERILTVVALVGASAKDDFFEEVGPVFVIGLCVMRRIKPELFQNAADGTLSWREVEQFMLFSEWEGHINKIQNQTYWAAAVKDADMLTPEENMFSEFRSYFALMPRLIEELDPPRT